MMNPRELCIAADGAIIALVSANFTVSEAATVLYWALHKIAARHVGADDAASAVRLTGDVMEEKDHEGESMIDLLLAFDAKNADVFEARISAAVFAGVVAEDLRGCKCDACTADRAAREAEAGARN